MDVLVVRDLRGRLVGYLDGDAIRDESGKPVAHRSGKDRDALTLADKAAAWMSGRSVLMDLSPLDVSTAATQAEYGIPALDCIADRVSPVEFVTHKAGVFYPENASDAVSPIDASAADSGPVVETNPLWTPTTFTTVGYAIATFIPWQVGANADFDVKRRSLRRLVEAHRLLREIRVATQLTTAGSYATANQIAASAAWNTGPVSAPVTDLFSALAASYLPVNAVVVAPNVSQYFHASAMRDLVQAGGQPPTPIFARAKVKSGGSLKYVWSTGTTTNVALVRTGDPDTINTSRTLRWLGEGGKDGERREGMLVRTYADRARGGDMIVVAVNDIEQIVSNQVGAIITGALQ